MIDIAAAFEEADGEFLRFERIENPPSNRADLCAFLLLDKLLPEKGDIVSAAEHDEIYLAVDCDELAKVSTQEDIIYLRRCGVRYDVEYNCLCMFV